MGDSWDDEDFEVPTLLPKVETTTKSSKWEEEEDELEKEQEVKPVVAPNPNQLLAAQKKAQQEEIALANHLKFVAIENETPEERKIRERRQVEEADTALAGELFGVTVPTNPASPRSTTSGSGLGGVTLNTKQDHTNFAILCNKKLSNSTPLHVGVYYKALSDKLKDIVLTDTLDEVITSLTKVRDERRKMEALNKKAPKKNKKELAAEAARHRDIFGDSDVRDDKYDHYSNMEDDFM